MRGDRPRRELSGKVKLKVEGNLLLHNMKKQMAFRDKQMREHKKLMVALAVAAQRRQDWQKWRL